MNSEHRNTLLQRHPMKCPNCGARMVPRVRREDQSPFWGCEKWPTCKTTHGAHPDGSPLGVPGTMEVKQARIRAHAAFDQLWKDGRMHRNGAYALLARKMGITRGQCHIGAFDVEQCEIVVTIVQELMRAHANDPARADKDQIRALLAERFGHTHQAARKARQWLAAAMGREGRVSVHEFTQAECNAALSALGFLS